MKKLLVIVISGAQCFVALAQSSPIIAGAGYSPPAPLTAAPGQLVTKAQFPNRRRSTRNCTRRQGSSRYDIPETGLAPMAPKAC